MVRSKAKLCTCGSSHRATPLLVKGLLPKISKTNITGRLLDPLEQTDGDYSTRDIFRISYLRQSRFILSLWYQHAFISMPCYH